MLLTILTNLDQIFLYKKIFINEQKLYDTQKNLDLKLLDLVNEKIKLETRWFLPDELSLFCQTGINIYNINLANTLHAYIGTRINIALNKHLIQHQEYIFSKMLPQQVVQDAHSITPIDLFGNKQIEQILFLDSKNLLWKYDVLQNQLFQQDHQPNAIDYIVGSSFFNASYHIYLRHRNKNNTKDQIKVITVDYKSTLLTSELITVPAANKFFMRANNLIFLYQDLEPQIYRLHYNKKLLAKKIKVDFNNYEQPPTVCLTSAELYWDQNKHLHIATITTPGCTEKKYEFTLPEDNGILSVNNNY